LICQLSIDYICNLEKAVYLLNKKARTGRCTVD
jgi:hypothetical protein